MGAFPLSAFGGSMRSPFDPVPFRHGLRRRRSLPFFLIGACRMTNTLQVDRGRSVAPRRRGRRVSGQDFGRLVDEVAVASNSHGP